MQQLSIQVANVAALLGAGYTHVEIWQRRVGDLSFTAITAPTASHAYLTSDPALTTFNMGGHTLQLSIGGAAPVSITFDSHLQQWTPLQVANRINEVVAGLASSANQTVTLTATTTGRASSILIMYNDSPDLGWVAGDQGIGLGANLPLSSGTFLYVYSDVAGLNSDLYNWRFSANGVAPFSDFSNSTPGTQPPLSGLPISYATALFADLSGQPIQRNVVVVALATPGVIGGAAIGTEIAQVFTSDINGFLAIPLVQGIVVRIALEGSTYVREITVPSAASFDLLTALADAPDPFNIQQNPPYLIRRSI